MVNQFTINVGFYMLMPYLAGYLAGPLGLAGWAVGLVLGVRNFSQQGMFLLGGSLADRFGYKPLIVAGCLLRTAGFTLLGVVNSLPALVIASAATGFAGALFNPAVRAYLAADADERRLEAFALFNVFYQGGILLGPVIGLALTTVDFRVTCLVAAAVFAVLTVLQIRALPNHVADTERRTMLGDWRVVVANRPFLVFALVMVGSNVLSFQVYLALPLRAGSQALVMALFVVSAVVAIAGQLRITSWFRDRFGPSRSIVIGAAVLTSAFLPPLFVPGNATLVVSAALLALGTAVVFPFEMDTIVRLSGDRLVATHYGFYNTIVGVGIMLGNLFAGTVFDISPMSGWIGLVVIGCACVAGLHVLQRSRALETASQ
ncbi:MFS transporter [Actinosynnema sp. ALI-1.44]|uniref:MFS transporter n=1 Tax=Actinosynnema sp. ALI-1.44 TaxID=1933779 RepID=UPI00097CA140|nr:MFS transporter [Actinosynnema sp. ALI-1.44]ONI86552.1 MFS transporter [Actinosynnema sp. ALI-1.44]